MRDAKFTVDKVIYRYRCYRDLMAIQADFPEQNDHLVNGIVSNSAMESLLL